MITMVMMVVMMVSLLWCRLSVAAPAAEYERGISAHRQTGSCIQAHAPPDATGFRCRILLPPLVVVVELPVCKPLRITCSISGGENK